MDLLFDPKLKAQYRNPAQIARVLTEAWVSKSVYCPNCGDIEISRYPHGRPVADFYCLNCHEDYELKSKQKIMGTKVVDGAYSTMLERLTSNNNPNLFLLNYDLANLEVTNFFVIPKHFFVPRIIEKRKPLRPTARRAG
jgi:type II restriction enzyme